jgi:hypothetical protein
MTKENYLKGLGDLLREHYRIIKETGIPSCDHKNFVDGYLTATRTLNTVYQKDLNDYIERVHFEVFGMSIAERKKRESMKGVDIC